MLHSFSNSGDVQHNSQGCIVLEYPIYSVADLRNVYVTAIVLNTDCSKEEMKIRSEYSSGRKKFTHIGQRGVIRLLKITQRAASF